MVNSYSRCLNFIMLGLVIRVLIIKDFDEFFERNNECNE